MFHASMKELKSVKCIVITGMLIACYVVLKNYLGINTPFFKINIAFIPLAAIGMLFGPFVSMFAGAACDLIAGITGPFAGNLNPIFTLIEMSFGLVYGLFLYKSSKDWMIVAAHAVVVFVGRMLFTTTALYFLTTIEERGDFMPLFYARLIKNLIEFPFAVILLFAVLIPLKVGYNKIILKEAGS
ncbi:MAG: folate family ECF transporter S component [Oscillospiraceae bacterium]|nr:folate family ECF transporter S component [Oscillospiraceae bacterium]